METSARKISSLWDFWVGMVQSSPLLPSLLPCPLSSLGGPSSHRARLEELGEKTFRKKIDSSVHFYFCRETGQN